MEKYCQTLKNKLNETDDKLKEANGEVSNKMMMMMMMIIHTFFLLRCQIIISGFLFLFPPQDKKTQRKIVNGSNECC